MSSIVVLIERRAGEPALLRAVVDQPLLADIQIARAGAAAPLVGLPVGEVGLKARNPRVEILHDLPRTADGGRHLVVHLPFRWRERLQVAGSIVDDANRGREAELPRARVDRPRVFGVLDAAAEHRVDVDVEGGVVLQVLQLLVEHPQALLGHIVGLDVVDADLQKIEPGAVELVNPFGHEKIAVRDEAGHHAPVPDVPDEAVEIRMQHRLAAAESDDGGAERRELVDPAQHGLGGDRRRHLVVLVAVAAIDVAAANGNDLHEQRVRGVDQAARKLAERSRLAIQGGSSVH